MSGHDLHVFTLKFLATMEDDNSFWLLAKNLKKRSFEARSDKHSWNILGYFYPVLHPLLGKCFCQVGGGAQDKDK